MGANRFTYNDIYIPERAYRSAAEKREVAALLARLKTYQGKPLPQTQSELKPKTYDPADIRHGHTRFLAAIGKICAQKKLRCRYVHGPLTEAWYKTSGDYVAAANRFVRMAGLTPVKGTPICLPWRETGDTVNHVIPALKESYSRLYLDLVKPLPFRQHNSLVARRRWRPGSQ